MANSKISALTSATTPLAGTETLPIVQSSTTKKTAVSTIKDYILGLANTFTANQTIQTTSSTASKLTIVSDLDGSSDFQSAVEVRRTTVAGGALIQSVRNAAAGGVGWMVRVTATNAAEVSGTYTNTFKFDETGNLIPQTAAKGINFTANTPKAGMTSQLLNWYEEGTWTPNQGSGLTVIGAFSSAGTYTRIGRQVTINGAVAGATSIACTSGGAITTNLPFTTSAAFAGSVGIGNVNQGSTLIAYSTTIYCSSTLTANAGINFTVTYFV